MTAGEALELPPQATDEEWARLHGSVAVAGSAAVQAALNEFHTSVRAFAGIVFSYQGLRARGEGQQVADAHLELEALRKDAYTKLDETERVMRDELAQL